MSHNQNFNNLVLDYPRAALALFAAETATLDAAARIVPVRQKQLRERLCVDAAGTLGLGVDHRRGM